MNICEDEPRNNVKCDFTQVEKFLQPRQNVAKKWHAKRDCVHMFYKQWCSPLDWKNVWHRPCIFFQKLSNIVTAKWFQPLQVMLK